MTTLPAAVASDAAPAACCENCGEVLLGPHCHACGQPVTGMVRHFSTVMGDAADTLLNYDSRTVRTMVPLLLRPGWLSLEYFRGHRVRYVTPVRLFFLLCLLAFLALRFSVDDGDNADTFDAIDQAQQVAEVVYLRDAALPHMEAGRDAAAEASAEAAALVEAEILRLREHAAQRITWLQAREQARLESSEFQQPDPAAARMRAVAPLPEFRFNQHAWSEHANPVQIGGLPASVNRALNRMIGRAQFNMAEVRGDRSRLMDAFLQTLPQTFFVLVPLFALLLKLVYVFSGRLYMEHLIVALHGHAFLSAMLLLGLLLEALRGLVAPDDWLGVPLSWMVVVLWLWAPLYLLLAQKRIYAQGWIMTTLKFLVLGSLHFTLVMLGLMVSLAVSLVAM